MREIKFRAWDSIGKQWLWITGVETAETQKSEGYTFGGLFHDGDYVGKEGIELMQFTGLHDKNGREIYEGDILHCFGSFGTKHKYEVKFGKYEQDGSGGEYGPSNCLGFYAEYLEKDKRDEYDLPVIYEEDHTKSLLEFEEYEVISNIHENPELLNG